MIPHENLDGIKSIWNFVLIAKNSAVTREACKFLIQLYTDVAEEFEATQTECTSALLKQCLDYIEIFSKDQEML